MSTDDARQKFEVHLRGSILKQDPDEEVAPTDDQLRGLVRQAISCYDVDGVVWDTRPAGEVNKNVTFLDDDDES